jgi:hypothetical protein
LNQDVNEKKETSQENQGEEGSRFQSSLCKGPEVTLGFAEGGTKWWPVWLELRVREGQESQMEKWAEADLVVYRLGQESGEERELQKG